MGTYRFSIARREQNNRKITILNFSSVGEVDNTFIHSACNYFGVCDTLWASMLVPQKFGRFSHGKAGRKAVPMDVVLGENYDLSTDVGFSNALFQVCNLSPGTSHTSAPVCSTFVWMNLVQYGVAIVYLCSANGLLQRLRTCILILVYASAQVSRQYWQKPRKPFGWHPTPQRPGWQFTCWQSSCFGAALCCQDVLVDLRAASVKRDGVSTNHAIPVATPSNLEAHYEDGWLWWANSQRHPFVFK